MRRMLIPISSSKKTSKNGATMSGAQHVITRSSLQKLYRQLQNAFKNNAKSRFWFSVTQIQARCGPRHRICKKNYQKIKKCHLFNRSKAQKYCKKQYEIKIFVVHNQHMTNTITHTRQMLITIKG